MPIPVDALFQGHDTDRVFVIYQTLTFKKYFPLVIPLIVDMIEIPFFKFQKTPSQ